MQRRMFQTDSQHRGWECRVESAVGQRKDPELDQVGQGARSKLYRCKRRGQRYRALRSTQGAQTQGGAHPGAGRPSNAQVRAYYTRLHIADWV